MQQNLYLKKFAEEILLDAAAFFQCSRFYLYYRVLFNVAEFFQCSRIFNAADFFQCSRILNAAAEFLMQQNLSYISS